LERQHTPLLADEHREKPGAKAALADCSIGQS
jgi:hypothetical protein